MRGFGDLQSEVCPLLHNFVEDSEVGDAGHVIHVGYEGVLSAPLLETFKEARVQKGLVEVAVSRRVPPARQNRVEWSKWILRRKLKNYMCCVFRDGIVKI